MNFRTDTPIEGIHELLFKDFITEFYFHAKSYWDLFPRENHPEEYEAWVSDYGLSQMREQGIAPYVYNYNDFEGKHKIKISIVEEK